jgi:hypothetical protein
MLRITTFIGGKILKKSNLTKFVAVTMLLVLLALPLFAQNTSSGNIKLSGAYPLEAKVEAGYTLKIPVLEGENPLFSGNNLKVKGLLGLSPVAATIGVDAVLTPIAVMELTLGGLLAPDGTLMQWKFLDCSRD